MKIQPLRFAVNVQQLLEHFREARGMSRVKLADAAGVHRNTVNRIEKDPDAGWSGSTMVLLFRALHDAAPLSEQELAEISAITGISPGAIDTKRYSTMAVSNEEELIALAKALSLVAGGPRAVMLLRTLVSSAAAANDQMGKIPPLKTVRVENEADGKAIKATTYHPTAAAAAADKAKKKSI
jgi:transcriptional regulator with XRE-family HTH domain